MTMLTGTQGLTLVHLLSLITQMLIAWLLCVSLAHAGDADSGQVLQQSQIQDFLTAMEGPWQGRAVVTPAGPLPYDIEFQRTGANAVTGTANPGAAIQHWLFSAQEKSLRLRFLTTFGGNTNPLFFTASTRAGNRFVFNAEQRDNLTVCVTPGREVTDIDVFLRGNTHVRIKLRRATNSTR
ncbi:MAG: hypothetical protein ACR2P1_07890 [Pseudomonadales bacterium]